MPKSDIHIRSASFADALPMLAMEEQSSTAAHWPESFYLGLFEAGKADRVALVADEDGSLRGFLIARIISDECELENVVVAEASHRRGIASKLIQSLIKVAGDRRATRIFLEVRESNAPARALYEKCRFAIHGRRKSYYTVPAENAVLYNLVL